MKIPTWSEECLLHTSSTCGSTSFALHHDEQKSRKRTKSVRISEEDNVVHDVLPLSEYTPEEVRSCWFSRVEYNSFKRSSLITLNLNREGRLSHDDPERTMRGLECRTREITDCRRALRDSATAAVLSEQYEQNRMDSWDAQAIADLYHSVSWKSQYTAYTQGLADEQDAQATSSFESTLFAPRSTPASKRNTVLSKIISIEREEPVSPQEDTPTIAGFDCEMWSSTATDTASFNLNSFFKDMPSMGIAVGAA